MCSPYGIGMKGIFLKMQKQETRRKELETKIARCLEGKNTEEAELLCQELESLVRGK